MSCQLYPLLQNRIWVEEQIQTKSMKQIAAEVGSSVSAVNYSVHNLHRLKMPKRTAPSVRGAYCKFPQLHDKTWLESEINAKPLRQVSEEIACSYGAVMSAIRKFGIAVPQRTKMRRLCDRSEIAKEAIRRTYPGGRFGDKAANWKGGRRKHRTDNGKTYFYIYQPDHPYATKDGYVMEHRLVMEKKLGRYLLPSELVHHRHGTEKGNGEDNLELMSNKKQHAKTHFDAVKHVAAADDEIAMLRKKIAELETKIQGS